MSKDSPIEATQGELISPTPEPWSTPPKGDDPQMDPGQRDFRHYVFRDGAGAPVAQVIVPKVSGTLPSSGLTCDRGVEYWFGVSSTPPVGSLTVTWQDYFWSGSGLPSPGALSFRMNQGPAWTTQMPAAGAHNFVGSSMVLCWNLTVNAAGAWGGSLTWFSTTNQNNVFGAASSGVTLSTSTAISARTAWYMASVAPY